MRFRPSDSKGIPISDPRLGTPRHRATGARILVSLSAMVSARCEEGSIFMMETQNRGRWGRVHVSAIARVYACRGAPRGRRPARARAGFIRIAHGGRRARYVARAYVRSASARCGHHDAAAFACTTCTCTCSCSTTQVRGWARQRCVPGLGGLCTMPLAVDARLSVCLRC